MSEVRNAHVEGASGPGRRTGLEYFSMGYNHFQERYDNPQVHFQAYANQLIFSATLDSLEHTGVTTSMADKPILKSR